MLEPEVHGGARERILTAVSACPGIHLRRVERETRLPLGQVVYHLDRLERMGVLASARDAGFRRFYLAREIGRDEKRYLAALRHDVPRQALLVLLRGARMHKELQAELGVAGSTLTFHLQRLVASGVLERARLGGAHVYSIRDRDLVRRVLIYHRESFRDPRVDRFVRQEIARLPPLADAS